MSELASMSTRSRDDLSLKKSDFYQMIRSQIDAENQLSNMRVIWLLIAEAFFMGAFGTIISSQGQGKDAAFQLQQGTLFWIIPAAGLIAATLGLVAIVASMIRIRQFEQSYAVYETHARVWDNSAEDFPPLQNQNIVKSLTSASLLGMPALFIVIWMVVFCLQVIQKLGSLIGQ